MKKTLRMALALVLIVAVLATGLIFANAADSETAWEIQATKDSSGNVISYENYDWDALGTNLIPDPTVSNFVDDGNGGKVYGRYYNKMDENFNPVGEPNTEYWWDKPIDIENGFTKYYKDMVEDGLWDRGEPDANGHYTIPNRNFTPVKEDNNQYQVDGATYDINLASLANRATGIVAPGGTYASLTNDGSGVINQRSGGSWRAFPFPKMEKDSYYVIKFNYYSVDIQTGDFKFFTSFDGEFNDEDVSQTSIIFTQSVERATFVYVVYTADNEYTDPLVASYLNGRVNLDDFGMYKVEKEFADQCAVGTKLPEIATAPETFNISFDAAGATNPAAAETDAEGKLAELPTVSKVGSIFNGWFDAQEGGNKITTDTVFTADTTVYAQWTVCDHTGSTAQSDCKNSATCTVCGGTIAEKEHANYVWKFDANQHWEECEVCQTVKGEKANHSGGTATCTKEAVCAEANCGQKYGAKDAANHESTEFTYVENADGTTHTKKNACCGAVVAANEAHAYGDDITCDNCGFVKPYEVIEGKEQSVAAGKDATFKIDADFSKFTNATVKVDGTVVAAENYTAVEGSIVITLKASYLETLDAGKHTLEVTLADGGVATTTFTTAKASGGAGSQGGAGTPAPNPGTQTGDFTNIALLFVLAMVSGLALTVIIVRAKKRA